MIGKCMLTWATHTSLYLRSCWHCWRRDLCILVPSTYLNPPSLGSGCSEGKESLSDGSTHLGSQSSPSLANAVISLFILSPFIVTSSSVESMDSLCSARFLRSSYVIQGIFDNLYFKRIIQSFNHQLIIFITTLLPRIDKINIVTI